MGLRSWMCAFVVLTALVVVACTSPGNTFTYKDVKISLGLSATPSQPVIGQSTTIRFTVRNTWNQPLNGIAWELRQTSAPASIIANGTADTVAFGSSVQEVVISPAAGTHTYEVVVDPANLIAEQDESNNTSSALTVVVADQDIAFSTTTAPVVTWPTTPTATDPHTLTFTITNTVNPAQLSPAATISVPFDITLNGAAVAYTATPASPATVPMNGSIAVSVALPAFGSAGVFVYTITLSPADGDDSVTTNNTTTVTVVIPASI